MLEEELQKISIYLSQLKPRYQQVLKLRFGLEDGIKHTLKEIGKELGVTQERIRQMEAKGLEDIRQMEKLLK